MTLFNKYTKLIPYLYFITVVALWFTHINRNDGIIAYPILLLIIPFVTQLIKPNKKSNFYLGVTFVCLSSYLIFAYLFDLYIISTISEKTQKFILYGGLFVFINLVMALWIIRNSLKERI